MDNHQQFQAKDKFYFLILILYALTIGVIFWKQFRPRIILERCSEISLQESQSYSRAQLATDTSGVKSYDELLNDCLQDFGF